MGLNRIYKVIWSKTKNAWVVVSEIAKRDGKSSVKSVVTSLAGKSVAAMMVAMVMCGGVASANTVYGPGATTGTSTNVTVVGDNAQVDNYSNDAVAIGSNAKTKNGTKSISIGSDSSVDGQFGIAIGAGATLKSTSTYGAIVMGYNAKNEYADVVIGGNSSAKNYWSTVVGGESSGVGQYSTLIGNRNIEYKALSGAASQTYANSILGHNNSVMGNYNTILGQQNIVNSNGSPTASGATGVEHNVVIGYANYAQGNDNIILGHNGAAITRGDRNISMGRDSGNHSSNPASDTIAIGSLSEVSGNNSIAMGHKAIANTGVGSQNEAAIAIGYHVAAGTDGLAIGSGYSSSYPNSHYLYAENRAINLGYLNSHSEASSVVIGADNKTGALNNSVVIGSKNDGIVRDRSITIGYNNTLRNSTTATDNAQRIVIGANNRADGENVVAIGNNIDADSYYYTRNAIIIGNNSRYSYLDRPTGNININGINIDSTKFAGNSNTLTNGSYMSIGDNGKERQIKNVAAGQISSSSTDAVNGSQLYEAVRAVTVGANPDVYMHVNDGTSTQGAGNATSNLGKANEKGGATGQYSITIGLSSTAKSKNSIVIGKNGRDMDADSDNSVVMGTEAQVGLAQNGIAIGKGAMLLDDGPTSPRNDNSIAIGNNAVIRQANNSIILGKDTRITGGDNSVVIGSNASVIRSQLNVGGVASSSSNSQYGNQRGGKQGIAVGSDSLVSGSIGSTSIGRYSSIIGADDSVVIGNYSAIGFTDDGSTITVPKDIHVLGNRSLVKGASNITVLGNDIHVEYVPNNPATDFSGSVIMGDKSTANSYVKPTDSIINGDTFTSADYAGQGTMTNPLKNGNIVSVGSVGNERQIKNVAAGAVTATSTDAVNGSQLYKTAETILKLPINMAGDSGDTVGLKLGKTVNIKGSVASGADVTDGNIAVVGDKATSTLSLKMAKNLTGLTSGTFTDATGNQTIINGAGVTVTPTGTGATPISITTSGINAGNQEIKGVKKGTTDDAAVNKKQMDDALAGISSTLTINDGTTDGSVNLKTGKLKVVGESGTNALVTTTVSGDTISVGTSTKLQNAVTAAEKSADKDLSNLSATGSGTVKTLAQDAVKVAGTGLATVSDATAAGVKTYTVNVDEGKLVIDDTTGKVGANGATQGTVQGKNGVATTQDVASVVNSAIDKTKQALDDAKHNFAGDDATVISRKHGEQLNIKGGASTTATDLTSGNIAVVGDTTSGTLNIKMAKALTGLTSATYTDGSGNTQTVTGGSSTISDAAGNSTVVSKGGVTTTDAAGNTTTTAPTGVTVTPAGAGAIPISVTTSGISAGNKEIKNVANGTTDDAAVNKKQMDDALKGATDNTVSLGSESGTTTAKKLSTTGGIKFNIKGDTGANALITTSATGDDVTIAPTAKLTAAVTAAEKSADKDLSNISTAGETVIKNLAATSAQDAVKVTGTGLATVSDSIVGGVKTYNVDVKTGNLVVNAAGQAGATGTTGAGGAAGADGVATTQNVASAINDAITKSKTDTAQAIADAEHKFDGDTGATSVRKHGEVLSVKGGVTAPTDLTTGNIGVVSDGAGTLNIRLAKVLSGLTSASFTNAGGDSTVINGNGVTITPNATGASPISMTTAGINAGNKEIKGVANATSADAAVNKGQMDAAITAAAGGSLSTEKVVAKTLTGDNNLVTVTGQTGTAKGETYEVAVSENAVKAVAQTAAQDAVKVTGTDLAKVTDTTTGGVKTYNVDVKTGNLVVNAAGQAGATGATGAGGAAGADGVATTQNVASAINDAITKSNANTAQALADAEHKFDGDTGTTSVRKHGEVLSVKGGVTATTDLTTGNIGVVSDGAGTLNIRLAKVLSGLTSATYTDGAGNTQTVTSTSSTITDGAGNTTTITKGGMTTTDGTNTTTVAPSGVTATDGTNTVKLNSSGIDAGNTQIKNVGKATTDDAAVNKKQMDDAVKAATDSISTLGDNKVSLGSDSGTTTAKKLSTTGGIKFNIKGDTGANALITTSATGDDVTIAPTAKLTAAVTAAENAANKDLSNLSAAGDTYIKNLAKTAASWNVETNGGGTTAVAGGETVNFINGDNIAITNTGRSITIGTAKNVSFDKVTVGGTSGIVIDGTTKQIGGLAAATANDQAVNKGQMDTAIANAQTAATSTEKVVAKALTGDNNLVTVTGQTGTAKGETYEVAVSENAVKAVAQTAAQDAVKVTGTGLATVTDSTTGGVKTYNVDVKTGNLVVNAAGQVGATGTTGAGGAAGADGVATTQNVASAINDAITKSTANTAQALANAEHKFDGDTGTTSVRKHGEVLSIKGGVTTPADLTTGNIGVVSDGAGTLNIRLAKTLTGLTSAAFTDGTHTVTIAGSGIDAGNTEIKHVGKATTDDAAVNKKQMDDAVKAATDSVTTLGDNKVSLGSDSGTTTDKKLSTTGGIRFNIKGDTGANALITTSATGDDVTIAPTAKLSAAVTAAENSANKDLSNLSTAGNTYIQNLAKSAASWNVETNGGGTTAVAGGDTVNFINGDNIAITNTGRSITIGTAKNVSFDKVTVGGVVIDKNNGIDAGGKEITNVGPATSGNSAVNKTQMDTAITNAVNKATTDAKHDFGGDDTTVVTRKHGEKLNIKGGASTTAADLTSGNIAVLGDAATGTLNIRMAKALTGLSSATFTTPSGTTVINGGGMTITPASGSPISVTTGGINAGNTEIKNVAAGTTPNSAVNKQQMDSAISNATANVGFSTAGNTGTGSVTNGQTLTITGTNGIETNASGQSITVGLDAATRAQINNATTTANNAAKKDLSNIDNAGKQVIKDTAAWNVKVNGAAAETVKGGDTVTFNDGDNIKVTNTGKDITIATKKDVSFDKVTVGNVVIDKNTNRISGLANAANNDDAVNLGQMNAAISTATAGTGAIKYKANSGTQNSVALTTGFDFKGDSNIQITADPANSGVINYKLNPALTGITSISGGSGAPTITLNAGSGSTPGNVSINSNLDMGGKQINNIGAATHAGDAVNKAQMDQALQTIAGASSNAARSYAYKAGAGAAALAALKPIQYDPLEPTQIMAGIGNYKSQTAVALGVAHYTNENTMFNLGVSLDSHDGMVNAGVTHKFGYSPEKKAIPDKYKGGPISSIYVMQDEVTALQAIVEKQAAENEALRQQNEDMQRKVDMILAKIQ